MFGVGIMALFVGMSLLAPQGSKGDTQLPVNGHKRKKRRAHIEASKTSPCGVRAWSQKTWNLFNSHNQEILGRNSFLPLWNSLGAPTLDSRTSE